MFFDQIKPYLFSVIGLVAGYFIKYFLDRRQALGSISANFKRKIYQGYVNTMIAFYQQAPTTDETELRRRQEAYTRATRLFHKKYMLDASPSVVRAITRQQAYLAHHQNEKVDERRGGRKTTKVFKAMRRDIGTFNWTLGPSADVLLGPVMMYHYEKIIHPWRWWIKEKQKLLRPRNLRTLAARLAAFIGTKVWKLPQKVGRQLSARAKRLKRKR